MKPGKNQHEIQLFIHGVLDGKRNNAQWNQIGQAS